MPNAPETQAFIDERKGPSVIGRAMARNAIKAFVPFVGRIARQFSLDAELLQEAEMAEPNPALAGLMEEGFQKMGAVNRQTQELRKAMRELAQTVEEHQAWEQRFRQAATAAGYTTT